MLLSYCLRLPSPPLPKPIIALTGAGGKTSLLFRLGAELAAAGRQTLLTATTRLAAHQVDLAPFSLVAADPQMLAGELPTSLRGYRQVLAMAGPAHEPGKLAGLLPDVVDELATLPDVEAVVVEADGSRGRPLKAPAGHEPVVPSCATHVIVVAGMAAVGQPLDERWVHRPEVVAELTGLRLGDRLTAEAMARLLIHPLGGLKGIPPAAQAILYLNLAANADPAAARLAAARQIAQAVLRQPVVAGPASAPRYRAVLIGNAQAESPVLEAHGRAVGVVLAAGRSERFATHGVAKQLLPWGRGNTLAGHVIDIALAAETLNEVMVVTGYQGQALAAALAGRPVTIVDNPAWQTGQSSSLHAALAAMPPDGAAAVFLLADQPDVTPTTVDALVEAHRRSLAPIVAPVYREGQRGNPVLFDRSTFPDLRALTGDVGGRLLIDRYPDAVQLVAIDQPQPRGIETWEDYRRRTAAAETPQ